MSSSRQAFSTGTESALMTAFDSAVRPSFPSWPSEIVTPPPAVRLYRSGKKAHGKKLAGVENFALRAFRTGPTRKRAGRGHSDMADRGSQATGDAARE